MYREKSYAVLLWLVYFKSRVKQPNKVNNCKMELAESHDQVIYRRKTPCNINHISIIDTPCIYIYI